MLELTDLLSPILVDEIMDEPIPATRSEYLARYSPWIGTTKFTCIAEFPWEEDRVLEIRIKSINDLGFLVAEYVDDPDIDISWQFHPNVVYETREKAQEMLIVRLREFEERRKHCCENPRG